VAASLLLPGTGVPINSYMRAYLPTGSPLPGYPSRAQGLDFLGAPAIADVDGDGAPEVIQGGDASALHAFDTGGVQAAGFPKFHTGWIVFGPTVGDLDGNGRSELAAATREGYVMVWNTKGRAAANDQWWSYRHDERNTGTYGIDTRPPGKVRRAKLSCGTLRFRAPGDDWYVGRVRRIRISRAGKPGKVIRRLKLVPAGKKLAVKVPPRLRRVRIQAYDDASNRSLRIIVRRSRPRGGCGRSS
jgi:hypothetical protein